jgi:hypothetical protein
MTSLFASDPPGNEGIFAPGFSGEVAGEIEKFPLGILLDNFTLETDLVGAITAAGARSEQYKELIAAKTEKKCNMEKNSNMILTFILFKQLILLLPVHPPHIAWKRTNLNSKYSL